MKRIFSVFNILLHAGILLVTEDWLVTSTVVGATGASCTWAHGTSPFPVVKGGGTKATTELSKNSPNSSQAAFHWYVKSCTEKPLITKGLTCGVIASLGDLIAQRLESQKNISDNVWLNLSRLATFFVCNAVFTGPFVHYWYQAVADTGNWVQRRFRLAKWKTIVFQVAMDQSVGVLLFFPLYLVFYDMFDALIRLNQVPSLRLAVDKCTRHLTQVILMQYRVFPITNSINFAFVPQELRVLFSNSVSLFWNIYLCSIVA
jgi:protein Mpv17